MKLLILTPARILRAIALGILGPVLWHLIRALRGAVVLALVAVAIAPTSAEAALERNCPTRAVIVGIGEVCQREFTIRPGRPVELEIARGDWKYLLTSWTVRGRSFVADGKPPYCRDYGRRGPVRILERYCGPANSVDVRVQTRGDRPVDVLLEWKAWRR